MGGFVREYGTRNEVNAMLDGSFWREAIGYLFGKGTRELFKEGNSNGLSLREMRFVFFFS